MENRQQLVTNYVRSFVQNDGGSLRFAPKRDENGRDYWEVFGVYPDGSEQQIKLSGTGLPKILKSADAVIAYWQSIYPEATEVTIPILTSDIK
jgi:predicted DCC family thiol-disulfide oxidoreductase YuxK